MADISSLSTKDLAEEGVWLDIVNLNEEPVEFNGKQLRVKLRGADSEELQAIYNRSTLKYMNAQGRKQQYTEADLNRMKKASVDAAVAATMEWENVPLDGALADCTPANARKAYELYNVMLDKVNEFIADRQHFTKGSSPS